MNGWTNDETWAAWTIIVNDETWYSTIKFMIEENKDSECINFCIETILTKSEVTPAEIGCVNFDEIITNFKEKL